MAIQQLITKLSVQGASQYKSQIHSAQQATEQFASSATRASKSIASAMAGIVGGGMGVAGGLGIAGGVGLVAKIGKDAFEAATGFDTMRRTLIALTGSAGQADSKLKFIDQLAIPSTNTTSELQQAAVALEAMGVRAEAALPSIAKLSSAFAFDPQALMKAVRMFGLLSQGQMPELELMAGLGIDKAQFAAQGIVFDKNGHTTASATKMMDALKKIIEGKFGDILKIMEEGPAAKMATLTDRWNQALRDLGVGIQQELLPYVEKLTKWLTDLRKNGGLAGWATEAATAINKLAPKILMLGGAIMMMVGAIKMLSGSAIDKVIGGLVFLSGAAAVGMGLAWGQKNNKDAMKQAGLAGVGGLAGALGVDPSTGAPSGVPEDPNAQLGWLKDKVKPTLPAVDSERARTLKYLAEISQNTTPLKDFAKDIFGGGDIGRLGITPVELAGAGRGGNTVTIQIMGGNTDQLTQQIIALKRRGIL